MGTVYRKTITKPVPAGLDKADRLAAYLGLRLVPDPDATPPEPTPANLTGPMLAKRRTKRRVR